MTRSTPHLQGIAFSCLLVASALGCSGAATSPTKEGSEADSSATDPSSDPSSQGASGGEASATASGGDSRAESESGSPSDADTSTDAGESESASGCEGEKVVHFVYFVESDEDYSQTQHEDIEAMAFAFQDYWYEQLGSTFYLNEPVVDVIMAQHESLWYVETPDGIHSDDRWYRLGNVSSEVHDTLGFDGVGVGGGGDHRVVNYPIARHDGRVGANFGGAWMDGDDLDCMSPDGPGVTYPYDEMGDAHCMGHPAHEFGHILGLDHQGPNEDCMQFGFYNNTGGADMCSFSAENVAQILADPANTGWFDALPGETCVGS
jgi:hypothetical protein